VFVRHLLREKTVRRGELTAFFVSLFTILKYYFIILISTFFSGGKLMPKKGLCRPDNIHWCVECCPASCPLLGQTEKGKKGCLAHWENNKELDGLTERSICQDLDCLADFEAKDRETIRQIILGLPSTQFKMSEVLSNLKIGERVCAWCKKSLGKKLGVDGKTHGICEDCLAAEIRKSDSK